MSGVVIPFLSSSRCALLLTDDLLCIYKVSGRRVSLLETVPWRGGEFDSHVADILIRESGGADVVILNDAVEQHYRKEKVPNITLLDKANVVQRRLSVAFPYYPVRAAMLIKAKTGASDAPKDGELYLFAAVPPTDTFTKVVSAIEKSGLAASGYGLLPIESASLVKELAGKIAKRKEMPNSAVWSVLIGQHRGGGLRQIVVKNGDLALTRVTPISEPDQVDSGTWAGDVSHEFQATLSYLSRFGYSPQDGLNVIVIAGDSLASSLEEMISVPCDYTALTVSEAASLLGVRTSLADGDHFSDALHVAWSAQKFQLTLPLISKELQKVSKPRKIASSAMVLLALGFSYFAFSMSLEAQTLFASSQNMEVAMQQKAKIEAIYAAEVQRKEAMGIDVPLIKGALAVHEDLEHKMVNPLVALEKISHSLKSLRVDGFEFSNDPLGDGPVSSSGAPPVPADPLAIRGSNFLLKISFSGTVKPQDGNAELEDLRRRLASALPEYDVSIRKSLADLTYRGEVTSETGLTAAARAAADRYLSEIEIKKVRNAENSGK